MTERETQTPTLLRVDCYAVAAALRQSLMRKVFQDNNMNLLAE